MKILVIFTGGTIGSEASGEYISIDGIKPYKLLQMYADAYPDEARDVRFDTESPYTVLSENADGNTFKKLFDAPSQIPTYAAAWGILLNTRIPICLYAAQLS